MKYISICSGIEAASVAWMPLGWEAVAFAEIEAFPNAVLAHHFPNVPNLGDISKVDWRKYHGAVDLIVGGTPCQSFSVAGKGAGMDGASGLVREYFRLLSECKPRWFVWENVPGVFSTSGGNDWLFILREWCKLGYHIGYRVLNAEYFGVPQRRRRVFVVGYFGNWRYPAKVLFEQYCLQRHSAPSRKTRESHSRKIKTGSYTASSYGGYKSGCGTLRASDGDFGGGSETLIAKSLTSRNTRLNVQDETLLPVKIFSIKEEKENVCFNNLGFSNYKENEVSSTLQYHGTECNGGGETLILNDQGGGMPGQGHSTVFSIAGNTIDRKLHNGGNGAGFQEQVSYTLNTIDRHAVAECYSFDSLASNSMKSSNPDSGCRKVEISKTLDTSNGDPSKNQGGIAVCHQALVRRLTPTECERLQGFPDGWTDIEFKGKPAPDGARYKALGNSMAVPVMQWIGKRIQMVEDGKL